MFEQIEHIVGLEAPLYFLILFWLFWNALTLLILTRLLGRPHRRTFCIIVTIFMCQLVVAVLLLYATFLDHRIPSLIIPLIIEMIHPVELGLFTGIALALTFVVNPENRIISIREKVMCLILMIIFCVLKYGVLDSYVKKVELTMEH